MSLLDQLRAKRASARSAAEAVLTRAADSGEAMTAEDLAEHSRAVAEEREAADPIEALHYELAELRASIARTPALHPPRASRYSPASSPSRVSFALTAPNTSTSHSRSASTCAGWRSAIGRTLQVSDVDFMPGIVSPVQQYPSRPAQDGVLPDASADSGKHGAYLSPHVAAFPSEWLLSDAWGEQLGPWRLQREFRAARATVKGLPGGFRFHDLRHYYASLLIASGLDVKVVQIRLRHASAKTTLHTYGHLWPDSDVSTRAAIAGVIAARSEILADYLRTGVGVRTHSS